MGHGGASARRHRLFEFSRDAPLKSGTFRFTEPGLGDEEREDLSEIATIATLQIAPFHASEGWRLTVTVEDEIGPRAPDDDSPVESEEEIDLDTFYKEYIRTSRGSANVVAEVDDPKAGDRMTLLLKAIERDQHGSEAVRRG
jgi:hypothetical protein